MGARVDPCPPALRQLRDIILDRMVALALAEAAQEGERQEPANEPDSEAAA